MNENDILYNANPSQNPCTFKGICKACTKVHTSDRPLMCDQLECKHYVPCPQCHMNRDLDPVQHICQQCIKANNNRRGPALSAEDKAIARGRNRFPTAVNSETQAVVDKAMAATTPSQSASNFTQLGTPPENLTEFEKNYFRQRWHEFDGFYRDPSAYFFIHTMIIAEVGLRRTEGGILDSQFELNTQKIEEKKTWLDYIALLKKQLPEKEAQRESDAETALGNIYSKYLEAKHLRHNGRVSRIFSPDAVALAPHLDFKIDLKNILKRLGYQVADIDTALELLPPLGETPEEALRAFGFHLDEQYAMPYQPGSDMDDDGVFGEEQLDEADDIIDATALAERFDDSGSNGGEEFSS